MPFGNQESYLGSSGNNISLATHDPRRPTPLTRQRQSPGPHPTQGNTEPAPPWILQADLLVFLMQVRKQGIAGGQYSQTCASTIPFVAVSMVESSAVSASILLNPHSSADSHEQRVLGPHPRTSRRPALGWPYSTDAEGTFPRLVRSGTEGGPRLRLWRIARAGHGLLSLR